MVGGIRAIILTYLRPKSRAEKAGRRGRYLLYIFPIQDKDKKGDLFRRMAL